MTPISSYILKSHKTPGSVYIGHTNDLKSRLQQHNDPFNRGYTKRHAQWEVKTYVAFSDSDIEEAKNFELYLKSSSGKAFMKKRLISSEFKEALEKFDNGRTKKQISVRK